MSKRFIETTIWIQNKWFRKLEPKYKLLWYYLISNCDSVGVWEEDLELASYIIGEEYEHDGVLLAFGRQIKVINNGKKWWLFDFCNFQYGELREDHTTNRPHQSYIALLKKHRLYIDYKKSIQRLKDKEQDKEQDKDKGINIEFDVFWDAYQKKADPDRCLKYWTGKTKIKNGTKINDSDREAIIAMVHEYVLSTPDKRFRKDPGRYLYNSSWKDEIIIEQKGGRKKLTNDRDVSQYAHLVEGPEL